MAVGSDKVSFLVDQIASRCGEWRDLFAAIGLTVVAGVTVKLALNFGKTLWIHYGGTLKQQKIKLLKYGQWAIINGCNDDIGKEFATQLANFGLDLILIASDDKQLTGQFVDELSAKYNIQCVKIYVTPGSNEELAFYDDIVNSVQDKTVSILIHNVQTVFARSHVVPKNGEDALIRQMNAHLFSITMLTHKILKSSFLPFNHGSIVFINGAVQYPSTISPVKYAAKSFIDNFAERLYYQMHPKGIHVQLLTPLNIWNPSHGESNYPGPTLFVPLVSLYTERALNTIGRTKRTTGYFPHTVQLWFTPSERWWYLMQKFSFLRRNR